MMLLASADLRHFRQLQKQIINFILLKKCVETRERVDAVYSAPDAARYTSCGAHSPVDGIKPPQKKRHGEIM